MKKVLIIEDEVELIDILTQQFEKAGWAVASAQDGKQGLSRIDEFKPHVILSDIQMPLMDGMQVLEVLYQRNIEIPLIFLSAFRDVENMQRAWRLCTFDFLDKPYSIKQVLAVMENAFDHGADYVKEARKRFKNMSMPKVKSA